MKLTTKGRYAVTAMLDLAIHYQGRPVVLADISERQGISQAYLEQLFAKLRRHKLVSSTRGPGGGYSLTRPADEIRVVEVIDAVDEEVDPRRCGGRADCQDKGACLAHDLWSALSAHIRDFFEGVTLGDLTEREGVIKTSRRQDQRRAAAEAGQ